jgi:glycosyltransferase involved in cell wall biosynthesis
MKESPGNVSSSNPHVLHLIDSLHHGGTELHVLKLTKALLRRGVQVSVVSIGRSGPLEADYHRLGVQIRFATLGSFRSLQLPSRLLALRRLIDASGASVVHAHDIYSNLAGAAIASGGRRFWSFFASQRWGVPEARGWRIASRFAFSRADIITANGPGTARIAADLAPAARSVVHAVPNFLEDECFARANRVSLRRKFVPDATAATKIVGYVGRLDRQKRVDWLLFALRDARATGQDARLVVVGSGAERAMLEDMSTQLGVSGAVNFVGLQPRLPLPHSAFDVLALASETEGVPNCLVEAMAAEVPVVATAVGGVSALLGQGAYGVLVPADDRAAFSLAIRSSIGDAAGDAESRARTASEHARDNWHEEVVVSRLLALYCSPPRG